MAIKLVNKNNNYQKGEFRNLIFEQYKIYIESAERISDRRQLANGYFVTLNTLLLSFAGLIGANDLLNFNNPTYWQLFIAVVGAIICVVWYRLVLSYRQLNSGKFKVIHEIENYLPLNLYKYEWEQLGGGKDRRKYHPFSHIERSIPIVFFVIYVIFITILILKIFRPGQSMF